MLFRWSDVTATSDCHPPPPPDPPIGDNPLPFSLSLLPAGLLPDVLTDPIQPDHSTTHHAVHTPDPLSPAPFVQAGLLGTLLEIIVEILLGTKSTDCDKGEDRPSCPHHAA